MQVIKIQNYSYNPNFSSWQKTVFKNIGEKTADNVKHRNTTYFYRRDLDWPNLIKFLIEKYKDTDKVNVYSYGCSNGSEPYTFLMQLCSNWPDRITKKFFPIIAKDYDQKAVTIAKRGKIPVNNEELNVIQMATNNSLEKFLDDTGDIIFDNETYKRQHLMKYNKNYAENIKYSVADIRKDYKNIKPHNSIVFARNFWPYLPENDINCLAMNLGNQLKEDSCLIIGNFDKYKLSQNGITLESILYANGFIKADDYLKNVFIKQ